MDSEMASSTKSGNEAGIFLQERGLTVYNDGSSYREPSNDLVAACPNPADPAQVASKDVPLSPRHGTSLRLFLPPAPALKLPVVLYFHGGAFMHFFPASPLYYPYLCRLAAHIPALVVAPAYRLAPEHPLPAAYDDGYHSLLWLDAQAALAASAADPWLAHHADFSRCFLAGDSGGGAVAHYTAMQGVGHGSWPPEQERKQLENVCIRGLLVIHPFLTSGCEQESYPPVSREFKILKCVKVSADDPLLDPLSRRAPSLAAAPLPCTCVFVGGEDVHCKSCGLAYYEGLVQAGKDAKLSYAEGQGHCFFIFEPNSAAAAAMLDEVRDIVQAK